MRELANVVTVHLYTLPTIIRALLFAKHLMWNRIESAVPTDIHNPVPNHTHIQKPNASSAGLLRESITNKKPKSPTVVDLHFMFSSVYFGSRN
jgi:hypothetical protein